MKKKTTEVRQVIVEVPVYDKNGGLIAEERLSSGGAREPDGTLIAQYRNPKPFVPTDDYEADREFDDRLNREYEDQRRREEARAQVESDRKVESASRVVNHVLEHVVYPAVGAWWKTRGPDDIRALGRWVSSPFRKRRHLGVQETAGVSEIDSPSDQAVEARDATQEMESALSSGAQAGAGTSEVPDRELADVIALDDYRDRRSA